MDFAADRAARLLAGERPALARMISWAENADRRFASALAEVYPRVGRAWRLGITGPPGAGKSSLVNELIAKLRAGGKTVGVLDNMKRRRDVLIAEEALRREAMQRLERSLLPMIGRAFQFKATRIERYLVACYDSHEGGYFQPHRDNEAKATAHRRFAVSINLNAEEFEGGELRFPEYGQRSWRAPTGGAVVFSCSLLHQALPVTAGRRYAFLPFLYDDAAARIREANNEKLGDGVGAYRGAAAPAG